MISQPLSGRKVVLAGATGKLGPSIARRFASEGAEVHLITRNRWELAQALATEIGGVAHALDLGNADAVQDLAKTIGPVWAIVCASNAPASPTSFREASAEYERSWQGSVAHAIHLVSAFCPAMADQGNGRVIALSSENAWTRYPDGGAYRSAKRALEGYMAGLVAELGPSAITVNVVAPGWINTEDADDEWYRQDVPLGRRGSPEDVANVVAWLAGDEASFVTGAWIPVNGGRVSRL